MSLRAPIQNPESCYGEWKTFLIYFYNPWVQREKSQARILPMRFPRCVS